LKTVPAVNEVVFIGAIVAAEYLFIEISEQVERFDVHISTLQSALEQTPEILKTVRVNLPINIINNNTSPTNVSP
jgi:hypothetical protein